MASAGVIMSVLPFDKMSIAELERERVAWQRIADAASDAGMAGAIARDVVLTCDAMIKRRQRAAERPCQNPAEGARACS